MPTNQEYDSGQDQEPSGAEYAFLEEKIKNERFDAKKATSQILKYAGMGCVFGIATCLSFFACKPWIEKNFVQQVQKVEIPTDPSQDEGKEEVAVEKELEQEQAQGEAQGEAWTQEDCQALGRVMSQIVTQSQKSIVRIRATVKKEQEKVEVQTTGVIVADNGSELLVLADTSGLQKAKNCQIQFADGNEYAASWKGKSAGVQVGVLSVAKRELQDSTKSSVEVAKLGNSNTLRQGRPVFAIGNLYGYDNGVAYGVTSTVNQKLSGVDAEYSILVTDIMAGEESDGILFDLQGAVVGLMHTNSLEASEGQVLTAYGISGLKGELELLSNGKSIPYLGLHGSIVPEEMIQEQEIPAGLYVTEVEKDSPAMEAGIQSGDIITEIGGQEISSIASYHGELLTREVGQELVVTGLRRGGEGYVEITFVVTIGEKK